MLRVWFDVMDFIRTIARFIWFDELQFYIISTLCVKFINFDDICDILSTSVSIVLYFESYPSENVRENVEKIENENENENGKVNGEEKENVNCHVSCVYVCALCIQRASQPYMAKIIVNDYQLWFAECW